MRQACSQLILVGTGPRGARVGQFDPEAHRFSAQPTKNPTTSARRSFTKVGKQARRLAATSHGSACAKRTETRGQRKGSTHQLEALGNGAFNRWAYDYLQVDQPANVIAERGKE